MFNKKTLFKILIVIIFGITLFTISVNKSKKNSDINKQYLNSLNIHLNGIVKNTFDLGHYSSIVIIEVSESNYMSFNDTNTRERFLGIIDSNIAKICISEGGFIKVDDSISVNNYEYLIYRNKELISKQELRLPSSTEYYNLKAKIPELGFN